MSMKKIEMSEDAYYSYMNSLINAMINPSSNNIDDLIKYGKYVNQIDMIKNITYAKLGLGDEYIKALKEEKYLPDNVETLNGKISISDASNIAKSGIAVVVPNKASVIRNINENTKSSKVLDGDRAKAFEPISKEITDTVNTEINKSKSTVSVVDISDKIYTNIKNTNIESQFKQALNKAFSKFKGLKYEWGGKSVNLSKPKTKTNGLDCSGLMLSIYNEGKIHIGYGTSDQSLNSHGKSIFVGNSKNNYKIGTQDLKPGDMVYLNSGTSNMSKSKTNHVMMYMGDGKFVHSGSKGGVRELDSNTAKKWLSRVTRVVRIAYNDSIKQHFIDSVNKVNNKIVKGDVESKNVSQRNKKVETWDFSKSTNKTAKNIPTTIKQR